MKELDARKPGRNTLEEIRTRAAKRVESGESPDVVIKGINDGLLVYPAVSFPVADIKRALADKIARSFGFYPVGGGAREISMMLPGH